VKTFTAVLTRPDPADPKYGRSERKQLPLEYGFPPRTLRIANGDEFEVFRIDDDSDGHASAQIDQVDYIRTGSIPRFGGED
jgi:hypothetical protein